ncbi:siderophore-interacting protein [Streptomyces toyocaensis]|uniref:Siderophore-interacting protein n=1 Tax=Streptomyces toyocaensis TaxID=55952 RepID=A0A081XMX0_STRTO|nr:SigE family RNA polymerase sigma factor [Streptomyces toyocaensis]KES04893.1 siderophore-interacting protein [Streptomyces toyocaensis]
MRTGSTTECSFDEFVTARRPALLGYADTLAGGDRHAAEDLVQEALVKLWLVWPRIANGAPEAYARRILTRAAARAARRRWQGERPTERLPEPTVTADSAGLVEDRLRLGAVLAQLPPQQRTAVVLRHYCDLPERQVAEDLNCAQGTVSSLASRGVAMLRSLIARPEAGLPA